MAQFSFNKLFMGNFLLMSIFVSSNKADFKDSANDAIKKHDSNAMKNLIFENNTIRLTSVKEANELLNNAIKEEEKVRSSASYLDRLVPRLYFRRPLYNAQRNVYYLEQPQMLPNYLEIQIGVFMKELLYHQRIIEGEGPA